VEAVAALAMLPVGSALFLGWHPGTPLPTGGPALATPSTMVFAAIVLAQMANAFECRSTVASLRALGPATNRLLVGAVAAEFLILLGFVYLGPMQQLLGHQPLTLSSGCRCWPPRCCSSRPRRPARRSPAVAGGRPPGRSARNRRATRP
jgi:magnesium-transporting ATPase (P-type)